jgi:hypothetical protein
MSWTDGRRIDIISPASDKRLPLLARSLTGEGGNVFKPDNDRSDGACWGVNAHGGGEWFHK